MRTKIIEAVEPDGNRGRFLLGRMDTEWDVHTGVDEVARTASDEVLEDGASQDPERSLGPLLAQLGWSPDHLWVLDLQTGEGAYFRSGGMASADLQKHRVWVCPMFEPFLEWLYLQDLTDLDALPGVVRVDHPLEYAGYRRPGPQEPDGYGRGPGPDTWRDWGDLADDDDGPEPTRDPAGVLVPYRWGISVLQVAVDVGQWVSLQGLGGVVAGMAVAKKDRIAHAFATRLGRGQRPTLNQTVGSARWAINEQYPGAVPLGEQPYYMGQGGNDWEVRFRRGSTIYIAKATWDDLAIHVASEQT